MDRRDGDVQRIISYLRRQRAGLDKIRDRLK